MLCMPSDSVRLVLLDIRDNAILAQDFVAGRSLETFKSDRRTFYVEQSLGPLILVVDAELVRLAQSPESAP
jgi:hypothetical protein